jgi:uncharacterized protein (TIGR02145 family)
MGFAHSFGLGMRGIHNCTNMNPFPSYLTRVLADSGTVKDATATTNYMKFCQSKGLYKNIKFGWLGEAGGKIRTSGVNSYWTKLYSLFGTVDSTQTTELSQMFRGGDISPYERYCMKNVNGASRFMTHSNVSFLANEAWSLTAIVNAYGSNTGTTSRILGNDAVGKTRIEVSANGGTLYVYGETANGSIAITQRKGLRTIIHLTYNGAGVVTVYVNGALIGTINVNSAFTFNTINRASGGQYFYGKNMGVLIRSGEMTALQVTGDCTQLDGIYAEYPCVQIGAQHWATSNYEAVCTPQGNLIQEMQASANVEKISGWNFTSGWGNVGGGTVINSNSQFTTTASGGVQKDGIKTVDKWHKLTILGTTTASSISVIDRVGYTAPVIATGFGTFYFKSQYVGLYIRNEGAGVTNITTLSCQEIGWAGSQELYDGIYAQTAGTVEQKTYAAVKAAGMWCHYTNDVAIGAVYGKLYNWYAAKLLQMDIDYYNAANPATPWGWKIPNDADFTTLQTTLGGTVVAGGKLKVVGTIYWTNNIGTDNSSGFSALGLATRTETGAFGGFQSATGFWISNTNNILALLNADTSATIALRSPIRGYPLRLIKV